MLHVFQFEYEHWHDLQTHVFFKSDIDYIATNAWFYFICLFFDRLNGKIQIIHAWNIRVLKQYIKQWKLEFRINVVDLTESYYSKTTQPKKCIQNFYYGMLSLIFQAIFIQNVSKLYLCCGALPLYSI